MQHSLVYASKSTLPSNEANAVHVVQMCDAFASQLQTVVLRGKRGAAHRPIEELYGLRNQFRVVYESAISRKLWLQALRLRAWLFGVSPGVIYYGRRMNALCALAAAGYPTALELHHPPRGSAQSAQLQAFAVQAGFLGLVVISEQLRTEILRLLPNLDPASVLVAHDGARGDRLHEPKLRNGERTRVLYCGSLHPGKGVETLIAAAQQCPDYDFHVIGGEPEQIAQLRTRAPTQVRFRGRLSHAQLQQEMPEYDIALAPYGRIVRGAHTPPGESLASWMSPLKIFEYMAAGLPIITSDLPVLHEILTPRMNALMVEPDDPVALAAAIRELAAAPVLRQTLARAAQERLTEFTWERRAQRILSFVEARLAASGHDRPRRHRID